MQKIHLLQCKNYIYFGVKITFNLVLKIHFFTVIHKYYSGYMHAVFRCKKDSGSTWEFRTLVKSVFFTADIFAVCRQTTNLQPIVDSLVLFQVAFYFSKCRKLCIFEKLDKIRVTQIFVDPNKNVYLLNPCMYRSCTSKPCCTWIGNSIDSFLIKRFSVQDPS